MGGVLAGSAARVAGGIGIVVCAAVIAFAAGGAGVFGGLGSLLGRRGASLQVANHSTSAADIVAAPTAADRAAALRTLARAPGLHGGQSPRRGSRAPSSPAPRSPSAGPTPAIPPLSPAPNPPPSVPPPSPPAPSPGSGQVVTTLGEAVKQVTSQAPPETQPLTKPLNDAVDTLVQACRGLPACP